MYEGKAHEIFDSVGKMVNGVLKMCWLREKTMSSSIQSSTQSPQDMTAYVYALVDDGDAHAQPLPSAAPTLSVSSSDEAEAGEETKWQGYID